MPRPCKSGECLVTGAALNQGTYRIRVRTLPGMIRTKRKGEYMELKGYYNMDCMEGMKKIPDKYFDLAIVDPPYGDAITDDNTSIHKLGNAGKWAKKEDQGVSRTGGTWASKFGKTIIDWDVAPPPEYFEQLMRVSRNQIIWGGNYFDLPPTRCFLIWRKTNVPENFTMAMAEFAWTSFNDNAKVFDYSAVGQDGRFHPTQKPVKLYKWILKNYAKPGDKILDTHVGSASSLIACEDMGFEYLGFEINKEYYDKGIERIEEFNAQIRLDFFTLLP